MAPTSNGLTNMPSDRPRNSRSKLTHGQRQIAQILAVERQNIECAKLNVAVAPARVQDVDHGRNIVGRDTNRKIVGLPINENGPGGLDRNRLPAEWGS
jgi:hypothetical protein